MKHLLILVVLAVLAMVRSEDKGIYTVVAQNTSANPAQLKIDEKYYTVTQAGFKKEMQVDEYKIASLSLGYVESSPELLTLSVYKGDKLVTSISGNTYMYILLSRDSATNGGGGMYRHRVSSQHSELYL